MASCITHIWNKLSHKQQLQPQLWFNRIIRAELKCCYPPLGNVITEYRLRHPEKGRQGLSWRAFRMIHSGILASSLPQISVEENLHPERSPHIQTPQHKHYSQTDLCGEKKSFFGGEGGTTAYLSLMLLISSGLILLELFYTYQQTKTKGTSCQNDCKVFAEHMANCSASLCLPCQSNTIIFECKGRHGSRPKMRHSWGQSGTGQPASTQTISIWGKFNCRNWWVLDMGVGYTTEGSVCRQVGHLGILPQHGVQINRDYNDKKGHPRDVTGILPFSFLKKTKTKQTEASWHLSHLSE